MLRIGLAIRAFFCVLFNRQAAERIAAALAAPEGGAPSDPAKTNAPAASRAASQVAAAQNPAASRAASKPAPARSDALMLLATLQREARLVDFLQEPLDGYSDAQIGAAARDVHRHAAEAIERLFALRPLVVDEEGAVIDVPGGAGATRFHLVGNVGGSGPRRGALRHKGWQATRCQMPQWTGEDEAKLIVAPAEVELS